MLDIIRLSMLNAGFGETCCTVTFGATFGYFVSDFVDIRELRAFLPVLTLKFARIFGSLDDR